MQFLWLALNGDNDLSNGVVRYHDLDGQRHPREGYRSSKAIRAMNHEIIEFYTAQASPKGAKIAPQCCV